MPLGLATGTMEQKIDVTSLKGIEILFKDDLHDLVKFVLNAFDARWAGTGSKARPALHGLARLLRQFSIVRPSRLKKRLRARSSTPCNR
jgi:hypothetical protein